ncbi:nucleoside-diphosphate kinase [Candidatus Falkowbacteria bacterium]|jgi:nucleoside-diphosphate kinase|nr:nucleoside-diphosphate kinase [Candidatus Falkowbacteria bacterium]
MAKKRQERTLVIVKPDALNRSLAGEIIHRFERKGLKIVGLKMMQLDNAILSEHYSHLTDKPFFPRIAKFMSDWPVIVIALEGMEAVNSVRLLAGETLGRKADAGTIRGDFSMSIQANVVHASDSVENARKELARFFKPEELFNWDRLDLQAIYAEGEGDDDEEE